MDPRFVDEQRAYWRDVDEERFRWQTGAPYIARAEAALLDGVALHHGERLLEIGCGEGANLHHLRGRLGRGAALFGVDFSPARARFASAATGAATACADGTRLPFCDAAFAVVLVRDLLHHVVDRAAVLAEARRVLAPGGQLHLIEPNRWNPLTAAAAAAFRAERGIFASTAKRLRAEVAAAGFDDLSVEQRQPMPVSRVILHHRHGTPSLGRSRAVQRALEGLERAAESLPRFLWAYLILHGRRP
jgi:SAM-dependent methyltransferase